MFKTLIYFLSLLVSFASCKNEIASDVLEPRDLKITVDIADDYSGNVEINASALNTVEYMLIIDSDEETSETNVSGNFSNTFITEGYHDIVVRAYGENGRYIKGSQQVEISFDRDVTIDQGYTTPLSYDGYSLIWNDEFEGTAVNETDWNFEIGTGSGGWGNNELQYYRKENASVSGGVLTIEAKEEAYGGMSYTSSRMTTKNKQTFQYGRIDIRALLPYGQGIWPALWMLGANISSVGWPACGETDIMEMVGGSGDNKVHGTVHWYNGDHASAGSSYTLSSGIFADEYHVFSIIWDDTSITWYMNDIQFYVINITSADMSEFHNLHFFIFNVAVGGNWPGSPDATTIFPQRMKVDYIRVFQPI